jgi:hypothetical protein
VLVEFSGLVTRRLKSVYLGKTTGFAAILSANAAVVFPQKSMRV